jgi:hypothetical protein
MSRINQKLSSKTIELDLMLRELQAFVVTSSVAAVIVITTV